MWYSRPMCAHIRALYKRMGMLYEHCYQTLNTPGIYKRGEGLLRYLKNFLFSSCLSGNRVLHDFITAGHQKTGYISTSKFSLSTGNLLIFEYDWVIVDSFEIFMENFILACRRKVCIKLQIGKLSEII